MNEENELNVSAIFKSIIDSRNFIILVSALFSTIALVYSLTLNNVYESKIELKYTDTMSTNREGSGLSFLDSLSLTDSSKSNKFIMERIKSRDFFSILYKDDNFLKNLMAYKSYDSKNNKDEYYSDFYNLEDEKDPWIDGKPSLFLSHEEFIGSNIEIEKDRESGLVTLTILHYSPYIAKEWSDKVLMEINTYMSSIDNKRASDAYNFLNEQLNKKAGIQMARTISAMMEKELSTLMFTEILDNYVFEIIDNSVVPERKSSPPRTVIVVLTGMISFIFCCILVIFLSFNEKKIILSLIPPKLKIQ